MIKINALELENVKRVKAVKLEPASEISGINKVQITVNGSSDYKFRDSIPLDTLFERNLDYVGGN